MQFVRLVYVHPLHHFSLEVRVVVLPALGGAAAHSVFRGGFADGADFAERFKERAIVNEEMGMYWKDNVAGYYWYQAPIETQALLIEAFDEVTNDQVAVEEMKVWLLKQKQTTDWKTTKATAEACYALLLRGTEILSNTEQVQIKVNGKTLDPKALGSTVEAGTGYFKTSWPEEKIS